SDGAELRYCWYILALIFATLLAGCGGGGGGGGATTTNIIGAILWIETGGPTSPATTVRVGNVSTTTDPGTGGFSPDVPVGATELTATYTQTRTSAPIVRTFTSPPVTARPGVGHL